VVGGLGDRLNWVVVGSVIAGFVDCRAGMALVLVWLA